LLAQNRLKLVSAEDSEAALIQINYVRQQTIMCDINLFMLLHNPILDIAPYLLTGKYNKSISACIAQSPL
jgi:hypothetical protein